MTDVVLDVGTVAHGGVCVARHEGRAVFVRHALPGERVRAVLTEERATYARADAVEVIVASPDRVVPPCPYAGPGRCGGCDWQHVALPAQRALKAAVVAEALRRFAGADWPVAVQAVPVPGRSDDGLGWRTRVQWAVRADGDVGLRRHRSDEVEPVEECRLATPAVDDLGLSRQRLPGIAAAEGIAGSAGDRAVVLTPRRGAPTPPRPSSWPDDVSVMRVGKRGIEAVRGRPGVREVVGGRTFWVGGSGFWQVHPVAAALLSDTVVELLDPAPHDLALDLYGGVGLFAAALGPQVREVVHVEANPGACADARQNLRDLPGVRVHEGRVDAVLRRLGLGRVDVVVLDPPRDGAGAEAVRLICGLSPRRVVYVACDPVAFARDLAQAEELGYRMTELRAYDLFPMTHHVECVALLEP